MKKSLLTAFAATLSIASQAQTNIVGGTVVNIRSIPWQVSLRNMMTNSPGIHTCGGTILSNQWILTAAHCVVAPGTRTAMDTNLIMVNAGVSEHAKLGQFIPVSKIYIHPNYNLGTANHLKNDIALIRLAYRMAYADTVQPIAYSTPCNTPITAIQNGTIATLSGWGRTTSNSSGTSSPWLKTATMPVIPNSTAYNMNVSYAQSHGLFLGDYNRPVTDSMIAFSQPGTGAGMGDSGGPATIMIDGKPVLIGACSWGYEPKDTLPTMYTKVREYTAWIDSITGLNLNPSTLDLYTKDNPIDIGYEGQYGTGGGGDKSPDIWVRNQQDGRTNQVNENPEFQNGSPVYVYVRVRNKSCVASTGTEPLSLYWSKASGWNSWPQNWDGTNPTTGNKIGTQTIPVIQPGKDTILQFTWTMVNPHQNNTWNSCLLSRIESASVDPITVYPNRLDQDVNWNNNISMRNVTVVDVLPGKHPYHGGTVLVGNPLPGIRSYNIRFQVPKSHLPTTPDITREAEVRMKFNAAGWEILEGSGQLAQEGIKIVREREIIVHKPEIVFENVSFPAEVRLPVEITFHFLMDENTESTSYEYAVSQTFAESPDTVLGTETYLINKNPRTPFNADAGGDKTIKEGESVVLSPASLAEVVTYNWYNEAGDLIYTGKDLTVAPEVKEKYKLEVIASLDGFKDYDEVAVDVKNFYLTTFSPNPATTQVTIGYKAQKASSAYLMIVQPYGNAMYNYVLPVSNSAININTSAFAPGTYNAILICDGQAVDAKSFIVQ